MPTKIPEAKCGDPRAFVGLRLGLYQVLCCKLFLAASCRLCYACLNAGRLLCALRRVGVCLPGCHGLVPENGMWLPAHSQGPCVKPQ